MKLLKIHSSNLSFKYCVSFVLLVTFVFLELCIFASTHNLLFFALFFTSHHLIYYFKLFVLAEVYTSLVFFDHCENNFASMYN